MTTLPRTPARIPATGASAADIARAVNQLENLPRVPLKTPVSGDDGYDGEICRDATRLYLYTDDVWKFVALSVL